MEFWKQYPDARQQLQDYEDIRCLREAKEAEKDEPTIGIDELKEKLGVKTSRSSRRMKRD